MKGGTTRLRKLAACGLLASAAALACAGDSAPVPLPLPPARLEVELLGGFAEAPLPAPAPRVALLVDATQPMSRTALPGASALFAARVAAERLVRALPADAQLDAWVLGGEPTAMCSSPPQRLLVESQPALLRRLESMRPAGNGSLSRALRRLTEGDVETPDRAVVFTTLASDCEEDLCAAAEHLVQQGARLELVVLGAATAPSCLATLARGERGGPLLAETLRTVPFCIETLGADAAVHACSETGGLPVVVPAERVVVDVALDPPLRIDRRFPRGTRWRLQVLAFPASDPPERQWRLQQIPSTALGRGAQAQSEAQSEPQEP